MGKVRTLQVKDAALNIPLSLRILADQIERGEVEASSLFVVWKQPGYIDVRLFGEDMDISAGMGIFNWAANSLFENR